MILHRDEQRSVLAGLVMMLIELNILDAETVTDCFNSHDISRELLFLDYYLYVRRMHELYKERT